jgi:hypothetical protein
VRQAMADAALVLATMVFFAISIAFARSLDRM